ncbi:glucose 1-dehydrogenase 2-like [Bicyclus anynana]|uniref:Glucose 1-dehydrogenase 2-like n=1 Tax=Bicyclus anynana TaxID=110368 RepID=A0A6J1NLI6_BICAN|nr:glucose 1-dehydrogenase 2-like [Bicyclus anynana]
MSFQNKVVIVTGASSGIGAAIALSFAKEGADVVIVARNNEKLKVTEAQCDEFGKKSLKILADVSKEDQAQSIIDETIEKYGKIDILINNAGIVRLGNITDGTILSVYDEIMSTNLRPVIHLTTLATPYLIKTKGNIINISSAGVKVKHPSFISYALSKSALNLFGQGAALELAEYGVRVNTISPGPVITDIWENSNMPVESLKGLDFKIPLKRMSKPEEIATIALFLADDKALGITGSNYLADNGMSLT